MLSCFSSWKTWEKRRHVSFEVRVHRLIGRLPNGVRKPLYLQDLYLFTEQRLRFGQVLLVDALHSNFPVTSLHVTEQEDGPWTHHSSINMIESVIWDFTSLCLPLNTTANAPWPIRSFLLNSNLPTVSMVQRPGVQVSRCWGVQVC